MASYSRFFVVTSSVAVPLEVLAVTTDNLHFLQVGCKMGCKFCATGSMGFKSNLSTGEIIEQLAHASRISNIRNVVFMVIFFPLQGTKYLTLYVFIVALTRLQERQFRNDMKHFNTINENT